MTWWGGALGKPIRETEMGGEREAKGEQRGGKWGEAEGKDRKAKKRASEAALRSSGSTSQTAIKIKKHLNVWPQNPAETHGKA